MTYFDDTLIRYLLLSSAVTYGGGQGKGYVIMRGTRGRGNGGGEEGKSNGAGRVRVTKSPGHSLQCQNFPEVERLSHSGAVVTA